MKGRPDILIYQQIRFAQVIAGNSQADGDQGELLGLCQPEKQVFKWSGWIREPSKVRAPKDPSAVKGSGSMACACETL